MKKQALIFDFFGVIASEVAPRWFQSHFSLKEALELKEKYVSRADLGEINNDQLMHNLSELSKLSAEEVQKQWNDLVFIDYELIKKITKLKEKHLIGICSNAASDFLRPILKKNNLINLFDLIVISSEVGMIKPSTEIFQYIIDKLNLPAQNITLIDDNHLNIDSAKQLGMNGILYKNINDIDCLLSD